VDEMLQKRDSLLADRDSLLAKLAELDSGIASLDNVITMFNPKHVPLDIRRVQASPILTIEARPLGVIPGTSDGEPAHRIGRPPKGGTVGDDALAAKVAERAGKGRKAGTSVGAAKQKKMEAAREAMRSYFQSTDKIDSLMEVLRAAPEGLPFRAVCDRFLDRHPLDIRQQEMKKVFSDRISGMLYSMQRDGTLERGPDNVGQRERLWILARPGKGNGQPSEAAQQAAE